MSGRIVALLAWAALVGLTVPAAARKDDKAEKMFQDVFAAWSKTANG